MPVRWAHADGGHSGEGPLKLWHGFLTALAEAAVPSPGTEFGLGRQEIKYVPTVDVAALRKRADEVAKACPSSTCRSRP